MTSIPPILELRAIEKRYGRTIALADGSLAVRAGTIHVLLGENGAGKTTLLRVAAGLLAPDSGEVLLDGIPVTWNSGAQAIEAGVGAVQQHSSLVPSMTVAENVALTERRYFRRFSPTAAARRVRVIAEAAGLNVVPDAVVGRLSVAAQQKAEIVKALAHEPRILILDEPTAVLSPADARDLFGWLKTFVSSEQRAVIVITHRIREALEHGDTITVLRTGRTVLSANAGVRTQSEVLDAILGEQPSIGSGGSVKPSPAGTLPAEPCLVIDNVCVADSSGNFRLKNASVSVFPGEIVGVAGVEGAGQHELLRVLAGRLVPTSGDVSFPESVGFVPEDRLRDALIEELSLLENFALRGAGARSGFLSWKSVAQETTAAIKGYAVLGGTEVATVAELSGGNQQRFVLARELGVSPIAVVAENPSRGLDVRAAIAVFDQFRAARAAGAAVVVFSTDIDELLGIADRIFVCHAGQVRAVPRDAVSIGAAMVGL
ncbi:MAG: ATP-binding cassette domain-containing protein [Gemmatimonadetes bacterium]|nr:ATP-binding cassette domain-containing protein [Gemmatimonadota bacterium]